MGTFIAISATGFFLTPFVLKHLGATDFAIYSLAVVVAGFVSILDFGLGVSAMKMIADRVDDDDLGGASALISSVFAAYAAVGGVIFALGACMTPFAPAAFHIPDHTSQQFRICWILSVLTVGLTFAQAVFTAALNGARDYATVNIFLLTNTAVTIGGTVFIIRSGGGVVALFVLGAVIAIVQFAVKAVVVASRHQIHIRLFLVSKAVLKSALPLASWILVINICTKVILDLDVIVAGLVIGPLAIASYQIATSLAMVIRRTGDQLSVVTLTAGAGLWSKRDSARLRTLFLEVNRITAVLMFPAAALTTLFGTRFLELWVGARIAGEAASSLKVLAAGMAVIALQGSSAQVLIAVGRHKVVAQTMLIEAAMNVVLSVLLAATLGPVGIALGTLIPTVFTTAIVFVRLASASLQVGLAAILRSLARIVTECAFIVFVGLIFFRSQISKLDMPELLSLAIVLYGGWIMFNVFGSKSSRSRYLGLFRFRSLG